MVALGSAGTKQPGCKEAERQPSTGSGVREPAVQIRHCLGPHELLRASPKVTSLLFPLLQTGGQVGPAS